MLITFDTSKIEREELSTSQFLLLLSTYLGKSIHGGDAKTLAYKSLVSYDDVDSDRYPSELAITKEGIAMIEGILANSDIKTEELDDYDSLAKEMIELFPKGKKPGTNYLWRDSALSISRRLKTLVTKYKSTFTKEQALEATRKYVESYTSRGDYKTMRLLKYFIFKVEIKDGKEEFTSDLLNYIENEDQESQDREDWMSHLC